MNEYRIEIWTGGKWELAKVVRGPRSLADGLLNQFGADYRARLLNQSGKVVCHRGTEKPAR